MIQIKVRLKPYLKEFLTGLYCVEIIPASQKNLVGQFICPLMEVQPKVSDLNKYKNEIENTKDERTQMFLLKKINQINSFYNSSVRTDLVIDLMLHERFLYKTYISINNQIIFESMVNEFFVNLFFNYIEDRMRLSMQNNINLQIKDAILQFCSDYRICFNAMNYDTLKKKYYRKTLEKSIKINKKKSAETVPVSSRQMTTQILTNNIKFNIPQKSISHG